MTSGIHVWDGDYDDWEVQPHCSKCEFETWSGKRPFDECVPPTAPGVLYVGTFVSQEGHKRVVISSFPFRMESTTLDFGFGGSIWDGARLVVSPEPISYRAGETIRQFEQRAGESVK